METRFGEEKRKDGGMRWTVNVDDEGGKVRWLRLCCGRRQVRQLWL